MTSAIGTFVPLSDYQRVCEQRDRLADELAATIATADDRRLARALAYALELLAAELADGAAEWHPPARVRRRNEIRALIAEHGRAAVAESVGEFVGEPVAEFGAPR